MGYGPVLIGTAVLASLGGLLVFFGEMVALEAAAVWAEALGRRTQTLVCFRLMFLPSYSVSYDISCAVGDSKLCSV